jgi:hypothetical protein
VRGQLFTEDFLREGIRQTRAWGTLDPAAVERFASRLRELFAAFPVGGTPNEAVTEHELIFPLLEALEWPDYLPQQTTSARGRSDVPDAVLFPNTHAKAAALALSSSSERYRHAIAILESKRWQRSLDRADGGDQEGAGAPSSQMLRYLSRAEVQSDRAVQWGILTNGRFWRLYFQGARSRSEEFLEADLLALVGGQGVQLGLDTPTAETRDAELRAFFLLFRRPAFLPDPADATTRPFLLQARIESRLWEETVSRELGKVVFGEIFPELVRALAAADPQAPSPKTAEYLEGVRRAALTYLYRLLFLLYAEDRNLLPVRDTRYDDYSLRKLRREIADRTDRLDVFSSQRDAYDHHLRGLFRAVAAGDRSIGLPAYDGGLFEAGEPFLERVRLPDVTLGPLIDGLSRRSLEDGRGWINYRDLSVQHLGSIYERLLEFRAVDVGGRLDTQLQPFARRGSGSYYTHDDLVELIVRRTAGLLVDEARGRFLTRVGQLASDRRPRRERLMDLAAFDPAEAILALRFCDPAMGSGHFLVGLVDFLADRVLETMAEAELAVNWGPPGEVYESPVASHLRSLRERILIAAEEQDWVLDPAQLDDRHLVRRLVLKRCAFGVDKNPMAVELAKVALWLHTFTTGAPLSFLDHHLRVGDSLFGEWVADAAADIQRAGALYVQQAVTRLRNAAVLMQQVSEIGDSDLAEVEQSKTFFREADATLTGLRRLLDLWHANRWSRATTGSDHPGLAPLFRGVFGDLFEVVERGSVQPRSGQEIEAAAAQNLLDFTGGLTAEERFLHWELAFPTVWPEMHRPGAVGGFDAVIGNPPWDRMKLQEVEWFAARQREIAAAPRAADRKRAIEKLEKIGHPLHRDYERARERAEAAAAVARDSGQYPLLARGDVNIYSLFVERAAGRLIRDRGLVGLLVPSGIASDKTAAEFFSGLATSGRLAALLDFENRKVFFPDVDSRFKFSVLVFGGEHRTFPAAECAFFLHDVAELADPETGSFSLSPEDFAAVNPNTGTAPVFRHRQDAEITTSIYRRLPVLVDRRIDPPRSVWPFQYKTLFHMTNDSRLFRRRQELETAGFYPVGGNIWRKGGKEYVPLYEGKMVQMYDHRAASIEVNLDNVHRPAQPVAATDAQHHDPGWLPDPQYWVPREEVDGKLSGCEWVIGFKEITAPTNRRTMIAAVLPGVGFGNTLPLLTAATPSGGREWEPLLLANLNSLAFDFVARQKVQGQHLNLYIVEQLPVIPPDRFGEAVGGRILGDFVRQQVLRLSYTAADLAPFARDLGYRGDPFPWDEDDRRHRIARLDALFFYLYGMTRDEADYALSQFPIVRADDVGAHGRFLTHDLVLAYTMPSPRATSTAG